MILLQAEAVTPLTLALFSPLLALALGNLITLIYAMGRHKANNEYMQEKLDSMDDHLAEHRKELKEIAVTIGKMRVKLDNQQRQLDTGRRS